MDEVESPVRKVGRPTTRSLARGRSSSLGDRPGSPGIPVNVTSPLAARIVVDVPNNKQAMEPQQPREEIPIAHAPIPVDPVAPAPAVAPDDPQNATPAPDQLPEAPRVDPKEQANQILKKRVLRLVKECQKFLEIYEGVRLNTALLDRMVATSDKLLANISECENLLEDEEELSDVRRELERWERIIETFMVSMLGKLRGSLHHTSSSACSQSSLGTKREARRFAGHHGDHPPRLGLLHV